VQKPTVSVSIQAPRAKNWVGDWLYANVRDNLLFTLPEGYEGNSQFHIGKQPGERGLRH
jgi:hypothetical protein